jgi:predicted CXXCH cytochrome family protein
MANASGAAIDGFIPADLEHKASGVHYRIWEESGRIWMSYERDAAAHERALNGRQELRYFIGSGRRGRTYLFERQGYWFESPINWYAKAQIWDMAPNHLSDREMPLTMPVDSGCLHCHASGVAKSLPEARNRYAGVPFAHGGITCESCHGNGSEHLATEGKAQMLKIDALDPVRRDSVCLNCHLEGKAAVDRQGQEAGQFIPGDNLFDHTLYFVYKNDSGSGGRATSQWEALLHSECKKKSGDRLTCTTCHDPHNSPPRTERVSFYRDRCLQCHERQGFAEKHHPKNRDCTACHMARPPTNDIAHEQVTDHRIMKSIRNSHPASATAGELEAVGGMPVGDRDLGIAYAQMAEHGDQAAGTRAMELLRSAEQTGNGARMDHELHAQLGFLEQLSGQNEKAAAEYILVLQADPYNSLAAGDLAIIEISQLHYTEATKLFREVFDWDPALPSAGMNLAAVECARENGTQALETLDRLLEFSPDDRMAKAFEDAIHSGKKTCMKN